MVSSAVVGAHDLSMERVSGEDLSERITSDGRVKVLDFGLDRQAEADRVSSTLSPSPTFASKSNEFLVSTLPRASSRPHTDVVLIERWESEHRKQP